MVSDAKPKIEAGDFSMPVVERIAPLEFLFLTCNNSDSYLRESREPLPAIYPLICQVGDDDHDHDHDRDRDRDRDHDHDHDHDVRQQLQLY